MIQKLLLNIPRMDNPTILAALIVVIPSLIQLSPLKLNPWDGFFEWLGNKMYGKRLEELEKQVRDMWVETHRKAILDFAKECREKRHHSTDEWKNILNVMAKYKHYCIRYNIPNGIIEAETDFLQSLYRELSREGEISK